MAGIDENLALNGDWGLPSPSPRSLFSRLLEEDNNNVIRPNSEHSGSGRTEGQDGDSGTQLSDTSYPTENKSSSRGGLVDRIAARTGFNAPRLNTESIRSTELSLNSEIQSPYLTIPPGLSPTTLLDSPVFLANSLAQPSPTTGKFPFVSNGNIRSTELSSDVQEKSKHNGFNDIYASSFAFKPTADSGPSFYQGAGRNMNTTTLSQQSLHGIEASVQSQRVDAVNVQTENKSSLHLKAEFSDSPPQKDNSTQLEEQADEEGEQRVNGDSLVAGVGGTPSEDGYNWRKYGQKQVKGSEYPRSYYKCTHSNCPVKKKVERSHEGHITEIIYKGAHNHPKPPPSRRSGIGSTNPHADMQVDNPEHGEPQGGGGGDLGWANVQKGNIAGAGNWKHDNLEATSAVNPGYGNQSTNLQTQNGTTHIDSGDAVDRSSTFSNEEEEDDQGTHGSVSLGYDAEGDESESKRRKLESYAEMSGATRAIREPRVVVQTTSEVDILDDGYRWRKYGQKVVKGNPNPRSYYKCTNAGCTVRKHVERASHDLKSVITTYEGKHNHDVPAARSSSHVNANASNAAQGQASGLLQNHMHRPEPSQVHNGMRPSLGSFNLPGRQQLGHPHDAIISSRRLSRFLSCPEHRREVGENSSCSSSFLSKQPDSLQDLAVFIQDACCSWSSGDEEAKNLVLNHVTLSLSKGSFVAVIGEVGSGKSSLIYSILGEMRLDHGSIYSHGSVAYVPQVPWVISGTVRDNILFGKSYNPERYADTINACALDVDISSMVGGDMAYIGEKGVNLSGGQRARLALARVLYHDSDVIMLDDILSAVDVQVAQWILHNAILGPLLKGKTRLLCTHNIQAISSADMTIVLDKGCVKWMGISSDFPTSLYTEFSPLNEMDSTPHNHQQSCSINSSISEEQSLPDRIVMDTLEGEEDVIEVELRKEGKVELGVYKNYAAFTGWFIAVIICLSALLMQASRNANDLWLSYWVDTTTEDGQTSYSMSFYLAILCLFCIMNSIFTLVRAFSFAFGGLQAATKVHNRLLSKLINAPVQFFDQTPGGRILNRLSSDLYTIDDSLPFILNILLANFVGLLGIAIILSYVQVFFLVLLLPFWYIYSRLQFFYRSTSRELRRLDSVSRSPIYTSFTETLDGSSTIRAFKSEDFFFSKFTDHITLYQKTSYTEIVASLWLSLRLQLLAAFIISFIALMAVAGSHGSLPINFGTPGLVGLALSYAAPIVSLLGSFLTSFTETEKEMVSIERALQYMDIPQEEQAGCQYLNPDWPNQGVIEFQHVTLKYMPSLPAALCNISFKIEGGTQVGIIGRTGAGKSSVLTALFRLTPICAGSITVDGMDIQNIPVRELRTHLAIVPQSPFLFEGSLRDNLDPFKTNDDSKIWDALEKCHVKEEVEAAGGLNVLVKEGGMSFSVGQRQLLCLARALLKSSKVLCLDECTASVDIQTASLLQSTISSECKGMTVITIAHRISTVINLDNILILDHGNLAEQGHPQILLKDGTSIFSSFVKASSM